MIIPQRCVGQPGRDARCNRLLFNLYFDLAKKQARGTVPEYLRFSYLLLTHFLQKKLMLKEVLWEMAWTVP